MPITFQCQCGTKLQVRDDLAGKNVKCTRCGTVLKVPAGAAPAAPKPAAKPPAKPNGAPAPAKKPTPAVAATSTPAKKINPTAPGKAPTAKTPSPPAAPKGPRKPAPKCEAFEELPDHLRNKARSELEADEHVIWAGQPWDKLTGWRALGYVGMGLLMIGVAAFFGIILSMVMLFDANVPFFAKAIAVVVPGVVAIVGVCIAIFMPPRVRHQAKNTAYVMTSKRCLVVHPTIEVDSYWPEQLQFMFRKDSKLAKGGGDLVLRSKTVTVRTTYRYRDGGYAGEGQDQKSYYYGFLGVENVRDLEDLVRTTLVDPYLAALERGEEPPARGEAKKPAGTGATVQSAAATTAAAEDEDAVDFDDPNEKDAPEQSKVKLGDWEVPRHLEGRLKNELQRGEKVVWTGKPDTFLVMANSMLLPLSALLLTGILCTGVLSLLLSAFGLPGETSYFVAPLLLVYALFGLTILPLWRWWNASRTDYVLTNRRAIIWKPGFLGVVWKDEYRPDQLVGMSKRSSWFFGDGAGDVIFRTKITSSSKRYVDQAGFKRTSVRTTITYFGFLTVRKTEALEALIREVLVDKHTAAHTGQKVSTFGTGRQTLLKTLFKPDPGTQAKRRQEFLMALAAGGGIAALSTVLIVIGGIVWLSMDHSKHAKGGDGGEQKGGDGGKPGKDTKPAGSDLDQTVAALKSDDANVRKDAVEKLVKMQPIDSRREEVARELEIGLEKSPTRWDTLLYTQALGVWGNQQSADPLIKLLSDKDREVRAAAITSLGQLKAEKAIEPIAARLVDKDDRDNALKVLEGFGKKAEPALLKHFDHPEPKTRDHIRKLINDFGTRDSDILKQVAVDIQSDNNAMKVAAADWLSKQAKPDPTVQADVAKGLDPLLKDKDKKARETAAKALIVWATKDNVLTLVEVLDDKEQTVRSAALDIFARLKDGRAAPGVAGRLGKDREKAVATLIAIGGPEAGKAALNRLETASGLGAREAKVDACKVLKEVGTKETSEAALTKAAKDKDKAIKAAADDALKAIQGRM